MTPELAAAMWAGDVDLLHELAPCRCCCSEHTFGRGCPAYQWDGCRGQGSEEIDYEGWVRFYMQSRGWTREQFEGCP